MKRRPQSKRARKQLDWRIVELAYLRWLDECYANAYLCYFNTGEFDYLCYFPVTQ